MSERSINEHTILGRLGQDAETKFTPNGKAVSTFSVATSRSWVDKNGGEIKEETAWHKCVLWDAEALAKYLTKGKRVHLRGRVRTREYEGQDGARRWITEVIVQASDVILLGDAKGNKSPHPADAVNDGLGIGDDDVPF